MPFVGVKGITMADALRLYGLKAAVLAGASGIGEAISRTLVKHGAEVLALDAESTGVGNLYERVRGVSGRGLTGDPNDIGAAVVEAADQEFGGMDILFNYVELPQSSPIADSDSERLQNLLRARSAIYESVTSAVLPRLKKSPAGRIINIGFVRSVFAIDGEEAYERSREALAEFSNKLALEHGQHGISANYIQPGAIMTRESRQVYSAATNLRDHCIRRSAARRLGEPVDVAKVALFLATDDASFVSGTGVIVDGGYAGRSF